MQPQHCIPCIITGRVTGEKNSFHLLRLKAYIIINIILAAFLIIFSDAGGQVPASDIVEKEFVLSPLRPEFAEMDYRTITKNRVYLRRIMGWGDWPADNMTIEDDTIDLARHYRQFLDNKAYAFAVLSPDRRKLIGCVYLFPVRQNLSSVKIHYWVAENLAGTGPDKALLAKILTMLPNWGFKSAELPFENANQHGIASAKNLGLVQRPAEEWRTRRIFDWKADGIAAGKPDISEEIRKHRMGILVIKTAPGEKVTVKQMEHEFRFGTAISGHIFSGKVSSDDKVKYLKVLNRNFNSAVHENALKWYSTEKIRDKISYILADTMLSWCENNGLSMRGHCIYWAVDKFVQSWIKGLDDVSLRRKIKNRAVDVVNRYKGKITEYDVNNEMLHGHYYEKRLGSRIRHSMFQWCREADPNAILYVNDYGILNGGDLTEYEKQIDELIEAKVPVGGIGLQGHFGRGVNPARVKLVLDRLARFNLPIKITEFDINNKNEDIKAEGLAGLYETAFAHPAVEGIMMWGFWEGVHWRPDAALWKKDWTPAKAAKAYRDLVYNRWWTQFEGEANDQGVCEVKVFFGLHEVTIGGTSAKMVRISRKEGSKTIYMNSP